MTADALFVHQIEVEERKSVQCVLVVAPVTTLHAGAAGEEPYVLF